MIYSYHSFLKHQHIVQADKRFSMLRRMSLITLCNLINAIVQCMSCCFGNGDLCRYGNHPQSTCSVIYALPCPNGSIVNDATHCSSYSRPIGGALKSPKMEKKRWSMRIKPAHCIHPLQCNNQVQHVQLLVATTIHENPSFFQKLLV